MDYKKMIYKEYPTCKACGYTFLRRCLSCCWDGGEKITCPKCGNTEKRDRKIYFVCPYCGEPIIEESKMQDAVDDISNIKFCKKCGEDLKDIIKSELEQHK